MFPGNPEARCRHSLETAAMPEQVIELSVEDSNKLRAQLGLAPLRGVGVEGQNNVESAKSIGAPSHQKSDGGGEEMLELSVEDTNALRQRLGLSPLREKDQGDSRKKKDKHAPAPNQGQAQAAAERVEKSKLKRQVEEGIQTNFVASSLAEENQSSSLLSWAQQMKHAKKPGDSDKRGNQKANDRKEYGASDLKGLSVAHSMQDLEQGSTTVLTLADTEILQVRDDHTKKVIGLNDEGAAALENVNLAEAQQQREGLQEKLKVEMGMGRAGGYAGFDDDEFVELGGTRGPSRAARGEAQGGSAETSKNKRTKAAIGFQIGAMLEEQEQREQDLFAKPGQAISLESKSNPLNAPASDFMTVEEDEELNAKKKKPKFHKKKKKKDKKKSKKSQREEVEDDEETTALSKRLQQKKVSTSSLLAELEETAEVQAGGVKRKRKVRDDDDDDDNQDVHTEAEKRSKYAAIMEKGNERVRKAFGTKQATSSSGQEDGEPDDAFLEAALSKARRLNRLKQMAAATAPVKKGEDAVLEAVHSMTVTKEEEIGVGIADKQQLVFAVDETREFTRALRARSEQNERSRPKPVTATTKKEAPVAETTSKTDSEREQMAGGDEGMHSGEDGDDAGVDQKAQLAKLAEQIKEEESDVSGGLDGTTTGSAVAMGRGLGGVLGMLKQTGEITKKNAGREEQRGRAKDERTYEDYEAMDLSKVVQLDERTATEQDLELAKREVKLEYRDKHGRLLTRKEAFRDLSYQFHGYGSGKRKQEKKLQQIAREQAEQRLSSRQASQEGVGILGALKVTQKATGKAFIVHKTS